MRHSLTVLTGVSALLGAVTLALLWRAVVTGRAPSPTRRVLWVSTIFYLLWVVLIIVGSLVPATDG